MVKSGYFLVWLALLVLGITATPGCAQNLPDLQTQINVNDTLLLARAETDDGNDFLFANTPFARLTFRRDNCGFTPVDSAPLSLRPTATDQNSDRPANCFGQTKRRARPRFALAPVAPCTGILRIDFSSACAAQPALSLTLWNSRIRMIDANALLVQQQPRERFHLRAALLQSLGFLALEHGFRFANDPYLRYLVFHKPFWRDYLASANNFEMNRW